MFDCSDVAELGYFTPSGLIRGNDDRGDGFAKVKAGINQKKRQRLNQGADNAGNDDDKDVVIGGTIKGSDEAVKTPPEQPATATTPTEQPSADNNGGNNTPATPPTMDASGTTIQIRPDELNDLVVARADSLLNERTAGIQAQMDAMDQQFREVQERADARVAAVTEQLTTANAEVERLNNIFRATGVSSGASGDAAGQNGNYQGGTDYRVNFNTLPLSGEARGSAKDFMDILGNSAYTPRQQFMDSRTGEVRECMDTRQLDAFVRKNREHLAKDMERMAKAHGLLRGSDATQAGFTLGTATSIPDGFLPYLSAEMRTTHHQKFIWWQFANFGIQLAQQPGQTVLVPRFEYLDDATSEADYIIDTATVSSNISTDNQALIQTSVPIIITGYGLGLGNNTNTRPVAIPEFIAATSMIELFTALNRVLGHNYNSFEDFLIRSKYRQALFQANNVWYNNNSAPTNDSTAIVAGSDGTMTEEFVTNMSANMDDADIEALEDGCRIGVLSTRAAAQFKISMDDKIQVPTEQQLMDMSNILIHSYPGSSVDRPMQYMGKYCGFHMYQNMSSSKGGVGSEGVYAGNVLPVGAGALDAAPPNTVTLGTATPANNVVRDSYFFGPGAVGKGTSLPMEIRQDDANQFGTKMRFIWRSIEGVGALDVSNLDTAGAARTQQNRVFVARTTDTIV